MPPIPGAGDRSASASSAHDPNWWAAMLTGALGGPLLALLVGSRLGLLPAHPVVIAACLLLPVTVAVPIWFLARTLRRRPLRRVLAGLACAVGLACPALARLVEGVLP
ncbi:hypothetical protein ABZ318_01735 [Streptomyces sp. NPDC006197]|uniref:hypothetical protein n=1 Tax=Streptomyces sp. NPDC006197 TaxID=3156685 RepID=UPI0033A1DA9A